MRRFSMWNWVKCHVFFYHCDYEMKTTNSIDSLLSQFFNRFRVIYFFVLFFVNYNIHKKKKAPVNIRNTIYIWIWPISDTMHTNTAINIEYIRSVQINPHIQNNIPLEEHRDKTTTAYRVNRFCWLFILKCFTIKHGRTLWLVNCLSVLWYFIVARVVGKPRNQHLFSN